MNKAFNILHISHHSGIGLPTSTALTTSYTGTAKLPVRYEIQTSVSTTLTKMRMMCASVDSIGGFRPLVRHIAVDTDSAKYTCLNSDWRGILAVRINPESRNEQKQLTVRLDGLSIVAVTRKDAAWRAYVVPNPDDVLVTPPGVVDRNAKFWGRLH